MLSFRYKLVTFDVTGTLLKPKSVSRTYVEFAKRCGLLAEPKALENGFRAAYKTMDAAHPNFGLETGLGWRSWWTSVVKQTLKSSVPPDSDFTDNEGVNDVANDLIEHYSKGSSWSVEKQSVEVLQSLKSTGAHLGVISNFDPRLHGILRESDLLQFFNFVLTSYEAKVRKPDVEIFECAVELFKKQTGMPLNVGEALHIGDSYDLDFVAARNAGWHSVLVNNKQINTSGNFLVFPNLGELKTYLVENG